MKLRDGLLGLVLSLAACGRPAQPAAVPAPPPGTPQPVVPVAISILNSPDTDPVSGPNSATQSEILVRVDSIPRLTDSGKDALYAFMERVATLGILAKIEFPPGRVSLTPGEARELIHAISVSAALPPDAILLVLAWADEPGERRNDLSLARSRALSVEEALRGSNPVYGIGMSGSVLPMPQLPGKPGIVEVWIARPGQNYGG